jgi:hypothetical protein
MGYRHREHSVLSHQQKEIVLYVSVVPLTQAREVVVSALSLRYHTFVKKNQCYTTIPCFRYVKIGTTVAASCNDIFSNSVFCDSASVAIPYSDGVGYPEIVKEYSGKVGKS